MDNKGYEYITGLLGMGEMNKNGDRFTNLYAFNKLVIGGTISQHKCLHKVTWISPYHTTENHIDYIFISKKSQKTIQDVRTRRGADIASDHYLVMAKVKLKPKKHWLTEETELQRFNTTFLRDTDKLNEFKITFNNWFQVLQDLLEEEEGTMEYNWRGIKETLTPTFSKVLGRKKHHHKEWISVETLDKIQERKEETAINNSQKRTGAVKSQAECTEANKRVTESIRVDKQKRQWKELQEKEI
ncbi:unnamed protein product [Schistosoma mattheei]|uniref:Uncharacterized protein n=1 Tax=Schistosoma mattheei TaxID=31246 RepID=A0A183P4I3_9TREM|nr:unnamed protein product [Schistosoma mattheei]